MCNGSRWNGMRMLPRRLTGWTWLRSEVGGGQAPWTGDQLYAVRFVDRDGKRQQLRVSCLVRPVPRVLVAARPIGRGIVLREEDVQWQQVERDENAPSAFDRLDLVAI